MEASNYTHPDYLEVDPPNEEEREVQKLFRQMIGGNRRERRRIMKSIHASPTLKKQVKEGVKIRVARSELYESSRYRE